MAEKQRWALLVAVSLSGCTGAIGVSPDREPGGGDDNSGGKPPGGSGGNGGGAIDEQPERPVCTERRVGSSAFRRLTQVEYQNTVRDLLRDPAIAVSDLPADGSFFYFTGNPETPIVRAAAERYMQLAEQLSARTTPRLGALVACGSMAENECAAKFIRDFGARAFRRPLDAAEVADFQALYTELRGGQAHAQALTWVVGAFLQSPFFLHHVERGDASRAQGKLIPLTSHEVAARLSYFLRKTMPDDELFAAAVRGDLNDPKKIGEQAARLLAGAQTEALASDFHGQVLELGRLDSVSKDKKIFPAYTDGLRNSMRAETERFIGHVYGEGDHTVATLLTAGFTFADAPLARVYGVNNVSSATPVQVALPPGQRSGLLTQASLLAMNAHADQTSPVLRGKFVRERLLCQELAAPPADVSTAVSPPSNAKSTRERFAAHSEVASCRGCHQLMDPIGFGFETYDGLGAYRDKENGAAIDASGEIVSGGEVSGEFSGAVNLGDKLARSWMVHGCLAEQWLSYAVQRKLEEADECAIDDLTQKFVDAGGDLRELLRLIPSSDAFRYRAAVTPEVCQ